MQPGTLAYQQLAVQNRRDDLIMDHLWLVRHVLGKMAAHLPRAVDVENLESAGMLGLVEAAAKFEAERGIKFATFAYTRVRGAILDELRRNCPLPQQMMERVSKVRKAYKGLVGETTPEALAATAEMTVDEVADCLTAMRLTRMISWEGEARSLEGRLADRHEQPDTLAERAEQKKLLAQALTALPERERLIVTLYYLEDLRLKEIGQVLKLSESRVSRLLSGAVFRLGEYLQAREKDPE